MSSMINLNEPLRPDLKLLSRYLEDINNKGWFTNFGYYHELLTDELCKYLDVDNLLLMNNATTALQVAGKVLNTKSILTTPFSFAATSSAFQWIENKITFSEINVKTLNICPDRMCNDTLGSIDTIVATHVFGNTCDIESLLSKNKKVIFDAAHSFGVKYKSNSVLSYGDASILSFHSTKLYHTIEGGAAVFKRNDDFKKAKELICFGLSDQSIGINGKLNEYQAAVGLVNLRIIDNVIEHRLKLFNYYIDKLKYYVDTPEWNNYSSPNGAYFAIILPSKLKRKEIELSLSRNSIQFRRYFSPSLDCLIGNQVMPVSRSISDRVLCLPLHYNMKKTDVDLISKIIIENV